MKVKFRKFKIFSKLLIASAVFLLNISAYDAVIGSPQNQVKAKKSNNKSVTKSSAKPIAKIDIYSDTYSPNNGWSYNSEYKYTDYYVAFDDTKENFPNIGGAAIYLTIGCSNLGDKRFNLAFTPPGSIFNSQEKLIYGNFAKITSAKGNLILLDDLNVPIDIIPIGPNPELGPRLTSASLNNEQLQLFTKANSIVIDTPRIGGKITTAYLAQIIPAIKATTCN